ncbi:RNA-binding protein 25-like isoform X2 [Pseudophryne corroboree]|uniref:RNA-binding protein 25-like isoform X2 n=1 Tax=Pseudophryne corroboree TaxID=495146 RepID=UPI003081670C
MNSIPEMTQYITNFSLDDCQTGNKGFTRVLLQLFGFLGHGKSLFINSCKYVLEDKEFQTYANVARTDRGNTTERITYPLSETLTLVDNRGFSVMNNYELGEVYAQLGIFPMVVLTHKTHENYRNVKDRFENMDVEQIFPVENFTPEDHLKTSGKQGNILKFFIEVIKDVTFRVERIDNPESERQKRKEFVLKYVYDRELQKQREEPDRQREEAIRKREKADRQREEADRKREEADRKREEADRQRKEADTKREMEEADRQREEADRKREKADRQREEADRKREEADRQREEAKRPIRNKFL